MITGGKRMARPLITVCIPMYNCQEFIEDSLCSICNQVIKDQIEVIIIDDCSTDNSYQIAKQYIKKNKLNGNLFRNDCNSGAAYCRNRAINEAQGEYIIFLDADDTLCENSLDKVLAIASERDFDMVFATFNTVDSNLRVLSVCRANHEILSGKKVAERLSNFDIFPIRIGCYIVKTDILQKKHIQSTVGYQYGEDQELNYLCILHSNNVAIVDIPIYNYRTNPKSAMNIKPTLYRFDVYKSRVTLLQHIKENFSDYTALIDRFENYLLPEAIIGVIRVLCYSNIKISDVNDFLKKKGYDKVIEKTLSNNQASKMMKLEIFSWLYFKYMYILACKFKRKFIM